MLATHLTQPGVLDLVNVVTLGEEQKSRRSSQFVGLVSLTPDVFHSTYTQSLTAREQVSNADRTRGKLKLLYVVMSPPNP